MNYPSLRRAKELLTHEQLRRIHERLLNNYGFSLEDAPSPTNARQAVQDIRDLLEHISELRVECAKWERFAANVCSLSVQYSNELAAFKLEQELGRQEQFAKSDS